MKEYIDVYEPFDFDNEHLGYHKPIIYSPVLYSWCQISNTMWKRLCYLRAVRQTVIDYRENEHDGINLITAGIYEALLEEWAYAKRDLAPFANQFCIAYKGYSLN